MPRREARAISALAMLAAAGCAQPGTVVVQVRTDLLPEQELTAVEVAATPEDGGSPVTSRVEASDERDWARGVRVAEWPDLEPGVWHVVVRALRAERMIIERPVRVEVEGGTRIVTVLLTRDCAGVACPAPDGDPTALACLGGRCVDEGCSEEDPSRCGEPECAEAADCGGATAGCAARECSASGACLDVLDHAACADGEVCSATLGCSDPSDGVLSPPGAGHVQIVTLNSPGVSLHRLELREGAPLEDLSAAVSVGLSRPGVPEDRGSSLSQDGAWIAFVGDRGGCDDCVVVLPVDDPASAEVIEDLPLGGSRSAYVTIASGGGRLVFNDASGELRLLTRDATGWSLDPRPLTEASMHSSHAEPSLSLDEERVLAACGDGSSEELGICEVGFDGAFREVYPPTGGITRTSVSAPRELTDGSVVFSVSGNDTELWRLPPGGGPAEPFLTGGGEDPCVLPDGRVVVRQNRRLELFAADGGLELSIPVELPSSVSRMFIDDCGL